MAVNLITDALDHVQANEIESLQVQIGNTQIPRYPVQSHAECF